MDGTFSPEEKQSLYRKYLIKRSDGHPLSEEFRFVLSSEYDSAALEALKTYQRSTTNQKLSNDLLDVIRAIEEK